MEDMFSVLNDFGRKPGKYPLFRETAAPHQAGGGPFAPRRAPAAEAGG